MKKFVVHFILVHIAIVSFGQNKSTDEEVLLRAVNHVFENTTHTFIHTKTGEIYKTTHGLAIDENIRIESQFNYWQYPNGVIHMAMMDLYEFYGDERYLEYPIDNYQFFAKLPTCIVGHEDNIEMPGKSTNLHYEGELAVVFSKKTQNISKEEVTDHILGVTIGNDVSERNWQREDPRWLLAKATDTFGPLGPWIVHGLDYDDLLIETRLNGETMQSQRTSDMFFSLEECVSYLSYYITFNPGDVLFLGTPGTTKNMEAGDTVEVEIEHIGILKNHVVKVD